MTGSSPADSRSEPNGFTLVEALVAFAILAISMVVLLQTFGTGLRSLGISESYAVAALHARSKMAEFGSVVPLEAGEDSGELDEQFNWRAVVADYDPGETSERVLGRPMKVYSIAVTVSWDRGREVTLTSLRIAPEEQ